MASFVIFFVIVAGLVSGDQESKTIDTKLNVDKELRVSSTRVDYVNPGTKGSPGENIPHRDPPDKNFPSKIHQDEYLPNKNLLERNLPHQNRPDQKPSAHQSLPHQNIADGNAQRGGASASNRASSVDVESHEMHSLEESLSPNTTSVLNSTSDCSTTPGSGTQSGTSSKRFKMLRKFAHRNTDASSLEATRSAEHPTVNKTREFLQAIQMIHSNESWTELYKKLPHKLRLAIAITNNYEQAFLKEAVYNREPAALDVIAELHSEKLQREREVLISLVEEVDSKGREELVADYKALRNGESWERNNPMFVNFFRTASPLLAQYETWKRSELEIDQYLNGMEKEEEREKAPTAEAAKHREMEIVPASETDVEEDKEVERGRDQDSNSGDAPTVRRRQTRSAEDSMAIMESYSVMQSLLGRLPDVLKSKMDTTDSIEREILNSCAASKNVTNREVDVYKLALKEERELLKRVLQEADTYAPKLLQIYKLLRRGEAWNYVKLNKTYEAFFQKPTGALKAYEGLKKDELYSLDAFLKGPTKAAALKQNEDAEEMYRMVRKEHGRRVLTEKGEKRKGVEREEKAAESWFRTEEMTNVETAEDVNVTTPEVSGTEDNPANDTEAEAAETKKTRAEKRTRERNSYVGMAILLSILINVTLVVVILAMYKTEIVLWYRRRQLEKGITPKGETEPLNQAGKSLRSSNTFM